MTGVELIAEERERQIEDENWTKEYDDMEHRIPDLVRAVECYAVMAMHAKPGKGRQPSTWWPWPRSLWKPSYNQLRNLAKAGALIAAEMDRLIRMDEQPRTEE